MSADDRMERLLIELLAEDAPSRPPDRLVPETLRALRHVRRWPRWFTLMKEPPMRYPSRVVVGSPTLRLLTIAALSLVLLVATIGAIAAGATVMSADKVPPPFGPAGNGAIVYAHGGDIYLADSDGSNERAIVTGSPVDTDPWFSHDGTKIAFSRQAGDATALMVAAADGTGAHQVLSDVGHAEFTASDDGMIVTRPVDGHTSLSIVDLETGLVRDLDLGGVEPSDRAYPRPPDGEEVVFVGYPVPGEPAVGLYAIGIDGTGLRTIGEVSTSESPGTDSYPLQWSFLSLSLSPDGKTLAYWNWEQKDDLGLPDNYLHLRDLDSGAELPILFGPQDGAGNVPRFSPDGRTIFFERSVGSESELFSGPIDGGPSVAVGPTYDHLDRRGWDLSPDGTKVLISLQAPSATSIVDLETGKISQVQDVGAAFGWQRVAD
jgi:hypothetical protein